MRIPRLDQVRSPQAARVGSRSDFGYNAGRTRAKTRPTEASVATFDSLWDYSHPAQTEAVFRELIATTRGEELCELLSQVARAQGLQRRFDEAAETLDQAEGLLQGHMPRARVRCILERGRLLNSSGDSIGARHLFIDAWHLARANRLDGLAVDAAHMIAIVSGNEEARTWNRRAIDLAAGSSDHEARRWLGSLYNNLGWTLHDQGQPEAALDLFQKAVDFREEQGDRETLLIAKWCVARCLRSMGRVEEALARQLDLREEYRQDGKRSGYVEEELAECLRALGRPGEATPHFAVAYEELSKDDVRGDLEPDRLERLRQLAEPGRATII